MEKPAWVIDPTAPEWTSDRESCLIPLEPYLTIARPDWLILQGDTWRLSLFIGRGQRAQARAAAGFKRWAFRRFLPVIRRRKPEYITQVLMYSLNCEWIISPFWDAESPWEDPDWRSDLPTATLKVSDFSSLPVAFARAKEIIKNINS